MQLDKCAAEYLAAAVVPKVKVIFSPAQKPYPHERTDVEFEPHLSCCAEVFVSFIEGSTRDQVNLLPPCIDDYVAHDALIRVVDAFVGSLDLPELSFGRTVAAATGRPGTPSARLSGCLGPAGFSHEASER